jgi:choline-sulfatase
LPGLLRCKRETYRSRALGLIPKVTALGLALLFGVSAAAAGTGAARPDIILVIVDAMRPDHLGCYGYKRPTSPNMDDLAAGGIRFETAVTQAPWTKGSLSSMFTSLYPFQHGATTWSAVMPDSLVTLAEILAGEGYHTMCVINMIGMAGRFQVLQGFERVSVADKYERNATQTTQDVLTMLADNPSPYFLVIHYYDAHAPYRPSYKYVDMVRLDSDPDPAIGAAAGQTLSREERVARKVLFYDGCIRYVDEELGRVVQYLAQHGTARKTLLIVTADHGEALGDRGIFGHGAEAYDDAMRVPLIMHWPAGFASPLVIHEQVRHIDLMPTILDIVGARDDERREGASLLPLVGRRPRSNPPGSLLPVNVALCDCTNRGVPGKLALRRVGWKLIFDPVTSMAELYDLRRDPGETRNIWGTDTPVGDSLYVMLRRVPTAELPGWRLAFTGGDSGAVFRAYVAPQEGGKLAGLGTLVRIEKNITVDVGKDSTYVVIESHVGGSHVIHFETDPPEGSVAFTITGNSPGISDTVWVGRAGSSRLGAKLEVRPEDAYGAPAGFQNYRTSDRPAAYIWYLGGARRAGPREATTLTPEEKKRLKALGYIQ